MKNESVFLVGMPRSGTTLAQTIIASSDEIFTFPESHVFNYGKRILKLQPTLFDKIIANIRVNRKLIKLGFKPIIFSNSTNFFKKIDKTFSAGNSRSYIEKTPSHLNVVPILRNNIPCSKFIFVIRDAQPNIDSYQRIVNEWRGNIIDNYSTELELRWISDQYRVYSYYNPKDSLIIKYEDLIDEERRNNIFRDIERFLRIKLNTDPEKLKEVSKRIIEKNEFWKKNNFKGEIRSFSKSNKIENLKIPMILKLIIQKNF